MFANTRLNFRGGVLDTLAKVHIFYVLYYFLGSIPRDWIVHCTGLRIRSESSLQSIGGLMDFGLLWAVVITGMAFRVLEDLTLYLRDAFLTKRFQFSVGVGETKQLVDAMGSEEDKLLQYLAFLDWRHLAEFSPSRRAEVFAISSPGAHPLHWNALCEKCLDLARRFSRALTETDFPPSKAPRSPAKAPSLPALDTSLARMRRMASDRSSPSILQSPISPVVPAPPQPSLFEKMLETMKTKPLVAYFVAELPEVKSRELFAQCQPLVWAIEG